MELSDLWAAPGLGFRQSKKPRGFSRVAMTWRILYDVSIGVDSCGLRHPVTNDSSALDIWPLT
jgi:hypothetical protein